MNLKPNKTYKGTTTTKPNFKNWSVGEMIDYLVEGCYCQVDQYPYIEYVNGMWKVFFPYYDDEIFVCAYSKNKETALRKCCEERWEMGI